jgi:hypothetical protein
MKQIVTYIILLILFSAKSFATLEEDYYSTHLELLNSSISGTEFYFTVPPALTDINLSNDKVYLYITSSFDTKVTLENIAKNYSQTIDIAKGQRGVFVLDPQVCQPYIKSGMEPEIGSRFVREGAMHMVSEHPVTAKLIVDYRHSSEGLMLFPVTALGKNYVVSSYNDGSSHYPLYNSFPSTTSIVALYDNTVVNFTFYGNKQAAGGLMYGNKSIMPMNKGDIWVISAQGKEGDISGSTINASKAVAVLSGCQSANVPLNNKYNNYLAEMDLPTRWWGNEYHISKIQGRRNPPIIRIYTLNELDTDTTIAYVHGKTSNDTLVITKSTAKYGLNFIEYRPKEANVSVESDKKIAVTLYNTGSEEDGQPTPLGAPFQMCLMPINSYSHTSSFFVEPSALSNPLSKYFVNLIAECNESEDLPLDVFIGKVDGSLIHWKSIIDAYVVANNVMPSESGSYKSFVIQINEPGYFVIKSGRKFSNYCYNFIGKQAFGYPAFMTFASAEELDKEPPVVSYFSDCPGEITGSVKDMPEDDYIRSNLSSVVFDLDNFNREIDPITPGETRFADWNIYVKNKRLNAKAVLQFRDYAGNDTIISFDYTAPKIAIEPNYKHFGAFSSGEKSTQSFKIVNKGTIDFMVSKIIVKSINSNFKIDNETPNILLKPNEEYNFQVEFSSKSAGTYVDSIGVVNPCYLSYLARVEAAVGQPVIEVTDVDFGFLPINTPSERYGIIFNKGISNLIITSIDSSNAQEFSLILDRPINPGNPLTIQPGGSYRFNIKALVTTKGDYNKYYTFSSNAVQMDSICFIYVHGINVELTAESYDFGRKRMNRTDFPIIPYPIANQYGGLVLENIGDKALTIDNYEIISSISGEAFEFNKNVLRNLEIKSKTKFILPVRFNPKDTGNYELIISYKIKGFPDSQVSSKLSGMGCVPRISCSPVEFDTLFQAERIHSKQIVIKNQPYSEWKWADTLVVYDFESNGSILFDKNEFSEDGFRINMENIQFPHQQLPGQDMLVDVDFFAGNPGEHKGELTIISDAENQATDKTQISVYVISNNVDFQGGEIYSCMNEKATISGKISNNTQSKIKLRGITIDQTNTEFTLLDNTLQSSFTLEAGESRLVPVEYAPLSPGDKTIRFILQDEDAQLHKFAEFKGKTMQIARFVSTTPVNQRIEPGNQAGISILLESGPAIDTFFVQNLTFEVNYNVDILSLERNNVSLGEALAGRFKMNIDEFDNAAGYCKITVSSLFDEPINQPGKLINFAFDSHIPFDKVNQAFINVTANTFDTDCVKFNCTDGIITLENFCMSDIWKIVSSSYNNALEPIAPNPTNANSLEVNYQLSFENQTAIKIYSIEGNLIKMVELGNQKPGMYSHSIDISNIASGEYFVTIESGTYSAIRKLMIHK